MKKPETTELIRKREKRLLRRENRNCLSVRRKKIRDEIAVNQEKILKASIIALKKDNKKNDPNNKRPGSGKFLSAFSFINSSPYDKRYMISTDYRSRSFNEKKQYLDFIKEFIYPYKIPNVLIWTAFEKETVIIDNNGNRSSPDIEIIQTAKKWINDIVSGNSFYKQNKIFFNKTEAHCFLNSETLYNDPGSLVEQYFYAKCIARKICIKQSRVIAKSFSQKFLKYWIHPIVLDFLDFLARNSDNHIENTFLGDICDFVLNEIRKHRKSHGRKPPFSFSGRTMASVIALANEWHAEVLQEQEVQAQEAANRQNSQTGNSQIARWKGISVSYSRIEDDEFAWSFIQLCNIRGLLNEGRLMKNCVSSYSAKCAGEEASIFHVLRISKEDQSNQDIATLEISRNRVLVQAKGKCNAKVSANYMKIIKKWAMLNQIKADLII